MKKVINLFTDERKISAKELGLENDLYIIFNFSEAGESYIVLTDEEDLIILKERQNQNQAQSDEIFYEIVEDPDELEIVFGVLDSFYEEHLVLARDGVTDFLAKFKLEEDDDLDDTYLNKDQEETIN